MTIILLSLSSKLVFEEKCAFCFWNIIAILIGLTYDIAILSLLVK